jgi:two-component system sensor histidine kinase PhoQ
MESYVYLVLAAAEVDASGRLLVSENLGDPRFGQPGSGIYAHLHGAEQHWSSRSSLGLALPELASVNAAEKRFTPPSSALGYYVYQYGLDWQLADGSIHPFTVSVLVEPEEIERQTSAFRLGLWRALVTAGIILLAAQLMMIYFGFRPLQKVAEDVALVETGQESQLRGSYPRELEPLARNVNQLLATEKANQQRYRNALDSLAHSLKTPLAIMQAGLQSDSPASRLAMRKAAEEMNQLVATRLQRASLSARRTMARPVAVAPQVERVLASLQKIYSHKLITADATVPPDLQFFGEERDLLELVGNLLDNAFKYGRTKIRITGGVLNPEATRPGLWLRIEDDGQGIDPCDWPALVQRGVRGDEREEGHGLGLAIVLELLTAYGGTIDLVSGEWGGAMLTVEIPGT